MDGCLSLTGMLLRLHHHVGSTFTEVQASPLVVEGTAMLLVEDHQRVETVEMEQGEGLRATSHNDISLTCLQQVRTQDKGIGGRGAGCGDRGVIREDAKMFGNMTGAVTTTVVKQILQMTTAVDHLCEIAFAEIHTCDGGAGDEDNF